MPYTYADLVADSYYEIGAYARGEGLGTGDVSWGQDRLNMVIEDLQIRRPYAIDLTTAEYTLTADHQPHVLGPGQVAPELDGARPMEIEAAEIVLSGDTCIPIAVRDAQWWAGLKAKGAASNYPRNVYAKLNPSTADLYFHPIPNDAVTVRLYTWDSLPQIDGTVIKWADDINLPPGYKKALILSLAEDICAAMGRAMPPSLPARARQARTAIQKNNVRSPRTTNAHPGIRSRGYFNYLIGE